MKKHNLCRHGSLLSGLLRLLSASSEPLAQGPAGPCPMPHSCDCLPPHTPLRLPPCLPPHTPLRMPPCLPPHTPLRRRDGLGGECPFQVKFKFLPLAFLTKMGNLINLSRFPAGNTVFQDTSGRNASYWRISHDSSYICLSVYSFYSPSP